MAEAPTSVPMETEETAPGEEEDEACEEPKRFFEIHKFYASGMGDSNKLLIYKAMVGAKKYKELPSNYKARKEAFAALLKSDAGLERRLLEHRHDAIKRWNKKVRAEAAAANDADDDAEDDDGVDDGPLRYPEFGESIDVIKGVLRERDDFLAAARERFGEELKASVLAQKLSKSNEPEDRDLVAKLIAHRDARSKAYRKALSSARGRKGRDGSALGSTAAPTAMRADRVSWSDAAGEKGTKALEEALEPLDETPPRGDAKWDAIAVTVSTAAGRDYTGTQCYGRASHEGYLRAELPEAHIYDPSMRNWRPRAMRQLLRAAGLHSTVPCGKAALKADAFKGVSTSALYERLRDVYNLGTKFIKGDREKIIAALVEADMCPLDPRENGATSFERASSARFHRTLLTETMPRIRVLASLEASEARLESPSDGDDLVRSNAAVYGRLSQQNLACLCFKEFDLEPHEAPSTRMAPLLNEYFFRPPYKPHVEYDAAQDCTCCRGLYEDNGFATCVEHDHGVQLGCCAIRNNGACEFAASPSFERRLRRRRLHASSVAWSVLLFNFHTGNKCNTSWIEFFDKLAREFKIETLREKRDVAVAANKRWGHLSPRRRAWKYD